MITIRDHQFELLGRAAEEERQRAIVARLRREHPGDPRVDVIAEHGFADAEQLEISSEADIERYFAIWFWPAAIRQDPFLGAMITHVLNDLDRAAGARLTFLEKHIASRETAHSP